MSFCSDVLEPEGADVHDPRASELRKIPAPIKIKLALAPPLSPPKNYPALLKQGLLWAWCFSSRRKQKIPGAHKIGAAVSGPRVAGGKITDLSLFSSLRQTLCRKNSG